MTVSNENVRKIISRLSLCPEFDLRPQTMVVGMTVIVTDSLCSEPYERYSTNNTLNV